MYCYFLRFILFTASTKTNPPKKKKKAYEVGTACRFGGLSSKISNGRVVVENVALLRNEYGNPPFFFTGFMRGLPVLKF